MLRLQELGYEVIAVAPEDNYSQRFSKYGIHFIAVEMDNKGTHPIKDSLLILRLTRLFYQQQPACVLSYTPKCNIYGNLAASFLHIPIINNVSGLGTAFIRDNLLTKIVKLLYQLSLNKANKVFFQNKDDRELFISNGLVKAEKTDLLPGSGVDTKHFSPGAQKVKTSQKFIFLFVARLLKDKGLVELVEATRVLKKQYPDIECQVLGFLEAKNPSAISKTELQDWVDEDVINYLGETDNVLTFLQQADCVVLPSYREGTPRSLLEAASVAKPIITTDVVGCREVVDDGINGFLCEVKNSLDLKDKMEKMFLLSEAERLKMGEKGRQKMIAEFDERIVINKYLQLVNTLVEQQV